MLKYRTSQGSEIREHKIFSESEKQITFIHNGRKLREAKKSSWQNWFDSYDEAKQFLLLGAEGRMISLEQQIETQKIIINKIKQL